jgi:alpha-L-fucosidase 2
MSVPRFNTVIVAIVLLSSTLTAGEEVFRSDGDGIDKSNVVWNSPSERALDSMPIGNGDIGLNVWVEKKGDAHEGDLLFYIAKSDSVSENGDLLKLGRIRVHLTPNIIQDDKTFRQELHLRNGEITVSTGANQENRLRIWVDANRLEIHVEANSAEPCELRAQVELWRNTPRTIDPKSQEMHGMYELSGAPTPLVVEPDVVLPANNNALTWFHRNERTTYPQVFEVQHLGALLAKYPDPLLHRTFGCRMRGDGLIAVNNTSLKSAQPNKQHHLSIAVHLAQTPTIETWLEQLDRVATAGAAINVEAARQEHAAWWRAFWNRSWINVSGPEQTAKVTNGYVLQRWMEACGGRGGLPMKFNGSLFTVGATFAEPSDATRTVLVPDWRNWGCQYWFQNQRHLYWPLIAAGDHDMLAPWFKMYVSALPMAIDKIRTYHQHGGAYFPETTYFWGLTSNSYFGWNNSGNAMEGAFIKSYWSGGIELTAMMLDYYDYTTEREFAVKSLVPFGDAIVAFFDEHWKRDAHGKIRFDPAQALETWHVAVNPMPEIAGLRRVLPRLLRLSEDLTTPAQRERWKKLLADLPPVPIGTDPSGKPILLPAEEFSVERNVENPELYAVFPFRIYGVGKPDLELARNTFSLRRHKRHACWTQDGINAALVGLSEDAKQEAIINFSHSGARFQAFWTAGPDWIPDMDNGGVGMQMLQLMLLQCDGRQIQLLPAWPTDWDVDFKLHAPQQTILEGTVKLGRLRRLVVTPESRRKNVVIPEPWK